MCGSDVGIINVEQRCLNMEGYEGGGDTPDILRLLNGGSNEELRTRGWGDKDNNVTRY